MRDAGHVGKPAAKKKQAHEVFLVGLGSFCGLCRTGKIGGRLVQRIPWRASMRKHDVCSTESLRESPYHPRRAYAATLAFKQLFSLPFSFFLRPIFFSAPSFFVDSLAALR